MPFEFKSLDIPSVKLVTPEVFSDDRGFLAESYEAGSFSDAGIDNEFTLDLLAHSNTSVLRGFHFQTPPYQQAKLVHCMSGEIFDVAVDLRANSETYGNCVSVRLSGDANEMVFIPRGFAHGYYATEESTISYKLDNEYVPDCEAGIYWNDETIAANWPTSKTRTVSTDDEELPNKSQLEETGILPLPGE